MSKIKIAEIFYTLQGEGKYVGVPTVFIRTFGCNFQCRGFGMPAGELTTEPEQVAEEYKKHPEWRYEDLPLVSTGCDSYASWHPAFKDLSPMMETDIIVKEVLSLLVDKMAIRHGISNFISNKLEKVHIVITGGEPLLGWQRAYPELFDALLDCGFRHFTFETNGTQKIHDEFADYLLTKQIKGKPTPRITFSVSAKLPCSGEKFTDALRPDVVNSYQQFGEVYLKYVIGTQDDIDDVVLFTQAYRSEGWRGEVYVMPVGGESELYNLSAPKVAEIAMAYGWRYSPRLQVDIWKNAWGT
jgi:7-carboxy-7-deazaguanine synthase